MRQCPATLTKHFILLSSITNVSTAAEIGLTSSGLGRLRPFDAHMTLSDGAGVARRQGFDKSRNRGCIVSCFDWVVTSVFPFAATIYLMRA